MKLSELVEKITDKKLESKQLIKRVPATVLSFTEGWLRADVRLANGTAVSGMLNKSGERLKVGQSVYIEYMTLPSSGWIAMTVGEADPIKQGGGGEEVHIGNAAIVTPEQADKLIAEEEILYVDEATPAKAVFGRMGNWFYCNGYPVWYMLNDLYNDPLTDDDIKDLGEELFPSSVEIYHSQTHKTKYEITPLNISAVEEGGAGYLDYGVRIYRSEYDLEDGAWVQGWKDYADNFFRRQVYASDERPVKPVDPFAYIYKPGLLLYSSMIFNDAADMSSGSCDLNIYPVVLMSDNGILTPRLTFSTSIYRGPVIGAGSAIFKNKAEVVFAFGMTQTTCEEV